jgi:excisionase family DNA binding protein
MALMTVRATAEVLGVHENTIRHWEERGILRAVRLPGSGFRRFPSEDVAALAAAMRASFGDHPAEPGVAEDRFAAGTYDASLAEQD